MIDNPFCKPRLRRPSAASRSSNALSPMSLLDRLREAVFRLIMLSAISKGNSAAPRHRSSDEPPSGNYYYPNDHHHNEAVADCLEFIKKSATTDDYEAHHSTTAVIPLPVM